MNELDKNYETYCHKTTEQNFSASLKTPAGPFVSAAKKAHSFGLTVIPCGSVDGKKPLVKWCQIAGSQPERQVTGWLARPSLRFANLGILTGASQLTVVDCDTPGKLFELKAMFGDTPLIVSTPRGGLHLYYRSNGERSGPLEVDGMKIDIKGLGGFVVAPPSTRRMPDGADRSYYFLEGDFAWVETLPTFRHGSLPDRFYIRPLESPEPSIERTAIGKRNLTLFNELRRLAVDSVTEADLLEKAMQINASFEQPQNHREITATVASVFRYKTEGRLITPSNPVLLVPHTVQRALCASANGADAFMLLGVLLMNHGARACRKETFAIAAEAMAKANTINDWGVKRYRSAIQTLLMNRLISIKHKGGKKRGDASLYEFVQAVFISSTKL